MVVGLEGFWGSGTERKKTKWKITVDGMLIGESRQGTTCKLRHTSTNKMGLPLEILSKSSDGETGEVGASWIKSSQASERYVTASSLVRCSEG